MKHPITFSGLVLFAHRKHLAKKPFLFYRKLYSTSENCINNFVGKINIIPKLRSCWITKIHLIPFVIPFYVCITYVQQHMDILFGKSVSQERLKGRKLPGRGSHLRIHTSRARTEFLYWPPSPYGYAINLASIISGSQKKYLAVRRDNSQKKTYISLSLQVCNTFCAHIKISYGFLPIWLKNV